MRSRGRLVTAVVTACLLGACSSAGSSRPVAATAYEGPLHLAEGEGAHPVAGAAGDVVDCDTFGAGSAFHGDVYDQGATADSPDQALDVAFDEGLFLSLPRDLAVAAVEDDRVLYVAEVDDEPRVAVIVHDGPGSEGAGGDGWHLESWAACDLVELPADFIAEQGYQVWLDEAGGPVPTRDLQVFHGAEHCGWQDMVFLTLGRWDDGAPLFVREPSAELKRYVDEPYVAHATLPAAARDTGYRRGVDHLWVARDTSRVYVGASPDDVEVWPRAHDRLGCA